MAGLADAPPPEGGAEGFYPDPLGGTRARWWDGTKWTSKMGQKMPPGTAPPTPPVQQAASTPGSGPIAAPTKLCPHCGAQAATHESKCPHCGKSYKKRTGLKIFAVLCGIGLLFLIGCVALIGTAVDEAEKDQQAHAITSQEFQSVDIGTSQSAIEKRFGEPDDSQDFQQKNVLKPGSQNSSCIYYNEDDADLLEGKFFQFCFTEGKLDSKNAY
jgi:hypothetical protein